MYTTKQEDKRIIHWDYNEEKEKKSRERTGCELVDLVIIHSRVRQVKKGERRYLRHVRVICEEIGGSGEGSSRTFFKARQIISITFI